MELKQELGTFDLFSRFQRGGGRMFENPVLEELYTKLKNKPVIHEFAEQMIQNPQYIPFLFEIIRKDPGTAKFNCEKVLRSVSEQNPVTLYPFFDEVAELLDSPNHFILWGTITTLANLVAVDHEVKFDSVYEKYFSLLHSDSMITAGNVAANAWKIAVKSPENETDITDRLLNTKNYTYLNKGEPSPECRNIVMGIVIDSFDQYFDRSEMKRAILDFVIAQKDNSRKAVARKASGFLKKHRPAA